MLTINKMIAVSRQTGKVTCGIGKTLFMSNLRLGGWLLTLVSIFAAAQTTAIPTQLPTVHPRILTYQNTSEEALQKLVQQNGPSQALLNQSEESIAPYVARHQADPAWMVSRLQMYWKTHATDVFVRGGVFDHASGEAPVPTVRYPGARDSTTVYAAPALEDMQPYADDTRGVYLTNTSLPGKPLEWANPSKTGRVIEAINANIMGRAETAAKVYWLTGDEAYARFAFDLFDTYMTGMYHRNEPNDLDHGHTQTIVGMSSFEVIQERILSSLASTYDFLYPFIMAHSPEKIPRYAETFKKWVDVTIKNGVPFNNWDLLEAGFVADVALVLDNNSDYTDGKGSQYYLDQILNKDATRQWSLRKLLNTGFDPATGIWYECPGYSMNVVGQFMDLVNHLDQVMRSDLLPRMPVLEKAVLATTQYLYPNGYTVAFGDSHYGHLSPHAAQQMIVNARRHGRPDQEERFTKMVKMLSDLEQQSAAARTMPKEIGKSTDLGALFSQFDTSQKESIPAGHLGDFVSPTFSAPNVSYFVQRNGLDPQTGLMISEAGSLGNHAHANGIAMELYGKGLVLAPEGGIGTSYFQPDYAEYYSQFPAHNTVVVDGISSYPTMKSAHGFTVLSSYPSSGVRNGIFPVLTYSDLYFLEPETNADQRRVMSIIRTSDSTGYYIDIFRSRKKSGGDKKHDYFYHDLGQEVVLTDQQGRTLELQPTEELTFADGDLPAYDYLWNKRSVRVAGDFKATFKLRTPGKEDVMMNMWMRGQPNRQIFSVEAPPSRAFRDGMLPKAIADLPLPTIVARQWGEAWTKPFVAVYEPSTTSEPQSITSIRSFSPDMALQDFVGISVQGKAGEKQWIFSDAGRNRVSYRTMSFEGTFGVVGEVKGSTKYLFLGRGKKIAEQGFSITAIKGTATAALSKCGEKWCFTSDQRVAVTFPRTAIHGRTNLHFLRDKKLVKLAGKEGTIDGETTVAFELPAARYTQIEW